MTAFVQISLELWSAWERGELSADERDLALLIAFKADFRTGELTTTLPAIASELGWNVADTTTGRRLERVRRRGFVEIEVVGRRPKLRHVLRPTANLLRTSRLAQVSAGTRAGIGAGSEASQAAGLSAPGAGIDAGIGAGEEEKRKEETLSRDQRGNGREHGESNNSGARWVENLSSYTGCRLVRGTHGFGHKRDPLGVDGPPNDWPHERPTREEVLAAISEKRALAAASERPAEQGAT